MFCRRWAWSSFLHTGMKTTNPSGKLWRRSMREWLFLKLSCYEDWSFHFVVKNLHSSQSALNLWVVVLARITLVHSLICSPRDLKILLSFHINLLGWVTRWTILSGFKMSKKPDVCRWEQESGACYFPNESRLLGCEVSQYNSETGDSCC